MKKVLFLTLTFLLSFLNVHGVSTECCFCKLVTNQIQNYIDESNPSEFTVRLMTKYGCAMLKANHDECQKLVHGSTTLVKKILYDSPPKLWCYNLEMCDFQLLECSGK